MPWAESLSNPTLLLFLGSRRRWGLLSQAHKAEAWELPLVPLPPSLSSHLLNYHLFPDSVLPSIWTTRSALILNSYNSLPMGSLLLVFSPPNNAAGGVSLMLKSVHVSFHLISLCCHCRPPTMRKRSTPFNLIEKSFLPTFPDSSPNISQLTVCALVTLNYRQGLPLSLCIQCSLYLECIMHTHFFI